MARLAMRSKAALIVGGVLVASMGLPAVAQENVGGQASCIDDPRGDTRRSTGDTDDPGPLVTDGRADITRYCVTSGPEASFHVSLRRPTDPANDIGWRRATFLGWFVDADNGDNYYIDFSLDRAASLTSATTARVVRGSDEHVTCTPAAQLTDTGYAISGVDASCFDGASSVQAEVAMYYDDGDRVVYDVARGLPERDIEQARATRRLQGADRTGTSVRISREEFSPGEARTVYLSRDDVFADAAVAGVLDDGPILVVPSCGTAPTSVRNEIDRLEVTSVTALGGTGAVCDQMLDSAADGRATRRIGGRDRYVTSTRIARRASSSPDRVYLARADEFIDAVAGGTLTDGPIVLVPNCGPVPPVVRNTIDDLDPNAVVALGGTAAICDDTLRAAANGRRTSRLAGQSRYGTAIQIARYVFPEPTAEAVYLARADLVVDALAGGVLTDGPVLVVDSCGDFTDPYLQPVAEEITRNAPDEVVALGGRVAICNDTLEQAGTF